MDVDSDTMALSISDWEKKVNWVDKGEGEVRGEGGYGIRMDGLKCASSEVDRLCRGAFRNYTVQAVTF